MANAASLELGEKHAKGYRPFIVRGYDIKSEVDGFSRMGFLPWTENASDIQESLRTNLCWGAHWELPLSACWWLWTAIKYPSRTGQQRLAPRLVEIQGLIRTSPRYAGLHQFADGPGDNFGVIGDGIGYSSYDIVAELLGMVIKAADTVCTTPHLSGDRPYVQFKEDIAKGIALDNACAMLQVDALLVWGDGCRPCAMAGDEKQLLPKVLSASYTKGGNLLNPFA